jgi:peptide/nickel transport system substrate-binding protein
MVMPAALVEAGNDFETNVIGTGPFIFDHWRSGDSIHQYANPNFFNPDRAARVEYVTWRVIPEGSSRTIALEMGEGDFNVYVAPPDVARMHETPGVEMNMYPGTVHSKLLMNNDLDMFADYRVRRALSMAVDIEAVILVGMEGLRFPTYANVPTIFGGFDPYEGIHSFDPQGALELLAEAGVDPSDITFSMIASNDERRRMGEVVQANLAEIGIHVEVEMNDLATTLERTQQGDFETGFGGFSSSTFLGYVRGVLHSSQAVPGGSNRSNFQNAEMDHYIDLGLRTVDANARLPIYQEIARIANTYTPHIPMYMGTHLRAWNSDLVVPELCPTGALNLNMMFWR